jgi:hypothetical protein
MTAEELEQAKSRLEGMPAMVDRFREQLGEEGAKDMEATIDLLRKALAANDLAAAQAQQDKLSTAMRSMMGGGRRNAGAGGPGGGGDGGSRADRGN